NSPFAVLPGRRVGVSSPGSTRMAGMKVSKRSSVAPFAVMEVLEAVGRRRAEGADVFSLCAGEPGGGTPADVRALAVELPSSGRDLGYTEALGVPELRR